MPTHQVTSVFRCTVITTFSASELPGAGDRSVSYDQLNTTRNLKADSSPPVTKRYTAKITGNKSLDLTALVDDLEGTVDGTGLKVQKILVNNLSTSETLTIADGGANPYSLNGGANIVIPAGGNEMKFFNDKLDDIGATKKAIDFTITAGHSFEIMILMG